jgi:hypothetical protein
MFDNIVFYQVAVSFFSVYSTKRLFKVNANAIVLFFKKELVDGYFIESEFSIHSES